MKNTKTNKEDILYWNEPYIKWPNQMEIQGEDHKSRESMNTRSTVKKREKSSWDDIKKKVFLSLDVNELHIKGKKYKNNDNINII